MNIEENIHEFIQAYLDKVYTSFNDEIKRTLYFKGNEIYGEILYYSAIKLFNYLNIKAEDHFLDIGSGLGKLAFYVYLATTVGRVSGVEINHQRHVIAKNIKHIIKEQLPYLFEDRKLDFIEDDFLKSDFKDVTLVYICSTIFSYELLESMGKKLNEMPSVKKIASFRKLPYLSHFKVIKKLLIHCSWERVGCYIYERIS